MTDRARKRQRLAADAVTLPSPAPSPTPTSHLPRLQHPPPLAHPCPSPPPALPLPIPPAFSVSAIGRQMRRDRPDSVSRIGSGAPVYMTAVLEYLTHELVDAAALQAKKQQQQRKDGRVAATRHSDATTTLTTVSGMAGEGQLSTESHEAVNTALTSNEPFTAVDDESDGLGWLAGEPTITPHHLAAVFQDNEDWAAVMREFTFDQPHTPPHAVSPLVSTLTPDTLDTSAQSVTDLSLLPLPLPPRLPPTPLSPPPSTSTVDESITIHSHIRRQLQPADNTNSANKPPLHSFVCPLTETSSPSAASPVKLDHASSSAAGDRPAGVRERGSKHYRPTLRANRGWAGGSKGDAVSRYQPVVRRSADGQICVENPFA